MKLVKMTKNLISGPILVCLPQIWAAKNFHKFYLYEWLDIAPSYYAMRFKGKLISHTRESRKKPNFGPEFRPFDQNVGPQLFFVSFTSTSIKTL